MAYQPHGGFTADANNSTASPLTASSTYTGTATDVSKYDRVRLTLKMSPNAIPDGDANTAQGSLYAEFSPDGTNWDISIPIIVRTGIFIPQSYVVADTWFRVRYINDGGASAIAALGTGETADTARNQTAFRLNVSLFNSGVGELGRTLDQGFSGSDPVMAVTAAIMGRPPGASGQNLRQVKLGDANELQTGDYGMEVSRGNLEGKENVRVEARNQAVNTTERVVWGGGAAFNFLTVASSVRIAAGGNAADTALGLGAREITVVGLDASADLVTETLATNGILASTPTTTLFSRVNDVYVSSSGTYATGAIATGSNTGAVTLETATATLLEIIPANLGRGGIAVYTVPAGKRGYFRRMRCTPEGSKAITFRLWTRKEFDDSVAPVRSKMLRAEWVLIDQTAGFDVFFPIELDPKEEVFITAKTGTGTSAASVAFEIELIDE